MRKFKKALGAGALTLALAGLALTVGASSASATVASGSSGWPYGCPSGYVCLYTGAAGSVPSGPHTNYYTYGAHNLSNVLGNHWIVNNQTGGAKAYTCLGYGGTNCTRLVPAGWGYLLNFTPINSIKLVA